MSFNPSGFFQGAGELANGFAGNAGDPFRDASKELGDFYNRAKETQNPFYKMGTNAIPQQQEWLQGQKDPSGFINQLMGKYSESPWAKFQQDQSARRFGNAGSASGLTGSTALGQFEQQNMHDISSQDMQQWLSNVLGINTQYGQGIQNEITGGQTAANNLSDINKNFGEDIAKMQYNAKESERQQKNSIWGGLFDIGKSFFG